MVVEDELQQLEEKPQELADLEQVDMDLATELLITPPQHSVSAEEHAKASNLALRPVPASLDAELKAYESYRLGEFSRFRTGAQVVI